VASWGVEIEGGEMQLVCRMTRTAAWALAASAAMLWVNVAQAQGITRGAIIATTCYTCHGTKGVSQGAIPSINDISPDRMARTLKEFRDGTRASTVMGRHASGYTDEEILEVAQYFGKLQKQGN
jgi:sulfide dehydrogenase cytochrome subunit